MMSTSTVSRSNKFPFTATQWQELEHQALIYKYMVAGIPIPPDLLFSVNRNLDSSSKLFPTYQTSPIGWNPYQMGMGMGYGGKKIDPEPGRCRRTDGKKWRCSKEAYPDSKYCERHMHRGKNRSRKPVEVVMATPTPSATNQQQITKLPNASSSSSSFHSSSFQSPSDTSFHYGARFDSNYHLYPHSSSRPPGNIDQDTAAHLLYDSASFRDRYLHGVKEDVGVGEHAFFTETSGATRGSSSMDQQAWQQHTKLQSGYPYLELKTDISKQEEKLQMHMWGRDLGSSEATSLEAEVKREITSSNEPRKTIHHFFDEWPPKGSRDSSPWHDSSTTQLSISMPTSSHDFFLSNSAPHNDG